MAPNLSATAPTGVLFEDDSLTSQQEIMPPKEATKPLRKGSKKIVWRNVLLFIYLHIAAFYGAWLALTSAKLLTSLFAYVLYVMGGLGITAGAHRLWAHKSYKAKWPLRVLLMLFNTLAFQNSIWEWSRDHRVHHKFSETDADPHNAKNGFFFAHVGWLLVKKHPDVIAKGKQISLDDLEKDKVVAFQRKYYLILMPIVCFIIPTMIPVYLWGETWSNAWYVATLFRYCWTLNITWLVNSAAHFYGAKPYDKSINPAENLMVAVGALGEGWHNYHHVFPWDYKTAELGNYGTNWTTLFIDMMAKIGWAYDMKTVSPKVIMQRVNRTGDGTHIMPSQYGKLFEHMGDHSHEGDLWGWGDKDMKEEDKETAMVINKSSDSDKDD